MSCGGYDAEELEDFDWTAFGTSYYPDTYKIGSALGREPSNLLGGLLDSLGGRPGFFASLAVGAVSIITIVI